MSPTVKLGNGGESFRMPTVVLVIGILVILGGVYYITTLGTNRLNQEDDMGPPKTNAASEEAARYFESRTQNILTERLGQPIEGFTIHSFLDVFDNVEAEDFDGVYTLQGRHVVNGGEISFESLTNEPTHSAYDVISQDGYEMLLNNVSSRAGIIAETKSDVDRVIEFLVLTSGEANVSILAEFPGKVVYGIAPLQEDWETAVVRDCRERGGQYQECGTACASDAEECIQGCFPVCNL